MDTDTRELAEYRDFLAARRREKNATRHRKGRPRSKSGEPSKAPRLTWEQLDEIDEIGHPLQLNTTMRKPRRIIVGTYLEHNPKAITLLTDGEETIVRRSSVSEIVDRSAVGRFRANEAVLIAPSMERAVVLEVDPPMVHVMRASDLDDPDFHLGRAVGWVHEDELRVPPRFALPRAHPGTPGDFVVEASRDEALWKAGEDVGLTETNPALY